MRILSVGEAMVEMAPDGAGKFSMNFAGDTLNTAWYLRRLMPGSATVSYLTAVGSDEISTQMVDFISKSGIDASEITRIPDRSVGLYMILLNNGERRFSYWRSVSAAGKVSRPRARSFAADLVYFSGITLAILSDEDRHHFLTLVQNARAQGARIAFDPNMRPRLWPDTATMRREILKGASVADLVLPSADEEAEHCGDPSPEATLKRYLAAGPTAVVVKNGAGLIHAADPSGTITFQPEPATKVVDTTAAGDSFNAGFIASWLTGAELPTALAQGAKVAAKVVQNYGALVEL
jgi:2-dehydro-3-deoxygluconokinase